MTSDISRLRLANSCNGFLAFRLNVIKNDALGLQFEQLPGPAVIVFQDLDDPAEDGSPRFI